MVEYRYDNPKYPTVGGYTATFSKSAREVGRGQAIAATRRVVAKIPYEPTGDEAFDIRAATFRKLLLEGRREAFAESPEGFATVGL